MTVKGRGANERHRPMQVLVVPSRNAIRRVVIEAAYSALIGLIASGQFWFT